MTSATTQDFAKIEALRAIGRQRGYSEQEIQSTLEQAGYATAPGGSFRPLGLAARGAVQGLGSIADLSPTSIPQRIGNQVAGIPNQPSGPAGANAMGLPTPNTPGERIGVSAAEGAAMSLPFGGGLGGAAIGAGASGAGQGAAEAGAGPLGQIAASAIVGMGLPVLKTLLSGGIRAALVGAGSRKESAKQALALFQSANPEAPVTLGQVSTGGVGRMLEGGLKNVPGASQTLRSTYDAQAADMGRQVAGTANRIGRSATNAVVGTTVQRGIEEGFIPRFKATADELYQKVYSLVPPTTPVMPKAVTNLIAKQNDLSAMARELSDDITTPKYASILTHLQEAVDASPDGAIPFGAMKELRSRLGAMLSGDELISDINLRDVKRLYGALSEDMAAGVQQAGGAPASAAWSRAQLFWDKGTDRIQNVLDPLMRKKTPEQAFAALMSGTKDGATALRSTMRSLAPAERRLVSSNVLRELGKAPAGAQGAAGDVFSPETYLTNWNKLAPETRSALFDGIDPQVTTNLTTLAKTMEIRKTSGKVLFNNSGTAPNNSFWAIFNGLGQLGTMAGGAMIGANLGGAGGAGIGAAAAPIASAVAGNQLAQRVFTNPKVIQWMVKQTKVPFGAMGQELAILAKDSQKWAPEDRGVAQDLTQALTGMDWRSILLGTAMADAASQRSRP